jgi:hypothetical protein
MSSSSAKPRKSKKEVQPEVIIQEAVPLATTTTQEPPKEDSKMERLSALVLTPETLPLGMKPESRLIEEQIKAEEIRLENEARSSEDTTRIMKLAALGAGIGVGVLLCVKGYKYAFPAIQATIEKTTEEIVEQ